jgi:hypothetical protein
MREIKKKIDVAISFINKIIKLDTTSDFEDRDHVQDFILSTVRSALVTNSIYNNSSVDIFLHTIRNKCSIDIKDTVDVDKSFFIDFYINKVNDNKFIIDKNTVCYNTVTRIDDIKETSIFKYVNIMVEAFKKEPSIDTFNNFVKEGVYKLKLLKFENDLVIAFEISSDYYINRIPYVTINLRNGTLENKPYILKTKVL